MTKVIGIYKITSPSGKVYIGQSWNILRRIWAYRAGKCSKQRKLFHSIMKYGWDNHTFEILHELPVDVEQSVLDTYEQLYMDQHTECGIELLNVRGGGSKGKPAKESNEQMVRVRKERGNYKHSEESINKIKASLIGNKRAIGGKGFTGKTHSTETREKIRQSRIGKPTFAGRSHSKETKDKLAQLKKGNTIWLGKTHTEESKKKIGAASKGRKHSEESLAKISAASKGVNNPRCKLTEQQVSEIKSKYVKHVYTSVMLAKEYGVSSSLIRTIIRGQAWAG